MLKKWWFWLIIILFIVINLVVTRYSNHENDNEENIDPIHSEISTH